MSYRVLRRQVQYHLKVMMMEKVVRRKDEAEKNNVFSSVNMIS